MNKVLLLMLSLFITLTLINCNFSSTQSEDRASSSLVESSSSEMLSSSLSESSSSEIYIPFVLTIGKFTDPRDGQIYKTTIVGTQVWMAENLNYSGDDGNGNKIETIGYCFGKSDKTDSTTCDKYGRLYDWSTSMNIDDIYNTSLWNCNDEGIQGVCPFGWHLPNDDEWETMASYVANDAKLIGYLDDEWTEIGKKIKSVDGWNENVGVSSDDYYGLSFLPSGYKISIGRYYGYGSHGYWWSSTESSSIYSYNHNLNYVGDYFYRSNVNKIDFYSVRCLQNSSLESSY